jgi:hypothetical protein
MRFTAVFYDADGCITSVQKNATKNVVGDQNYLQIDFEGNPEDFYVEGGILVEKPAQLSTQHTFDYATKQWVYDLTRHRQEKWTQIKAARNAEEFGTFTWSTHTFQCDQVSQRRIQGAVQLAQLDSAMTLDWTLADNSVQTFNATELQQIGQALAAHVDACHVKSRTKRGEIDAATTEAELGTVVW